MKDFIEKMKAVFASLKKAYVSAGIFGPMVLVVTSFLVLWLVLILLPLTPLSIAIILILTAINSLFSFFLGKKKKDIDDI